MPTKRIVILTDAWGPKHGGINAFNLDLCGALGKLLSPSYQVICVVLEAEQREIVEAQRHQVLLLPIGKSRYHGHFEANRADDVWRKIKGLEDVGPVEWWIGHDVITGEIATRLPQVSGEGQSAVIMHMSYADYISIKSGVGAKAQNKHELQAEVFGQADRCFSVGPLLRDRLKDLIEHDDVTMLVPGLPDILPAKEQSVFTAMTFGRLDPENDRIKQGRLAVAAFAAAVGWARTQAGAPRNLSNSPQMKLFGISSVGGEEEKSLRALAQKKADRPINLIALPYEEKRDKLFADLRKVSVALMLSWHEGFGLTGWEAIAAGVPLIISRQSGLFQLVEEVLPGAGPGCLRVVDIRGNLGEPNEENFQQADEEAVRDAILDCAANIDKARQAAQTLRSLLLKEGYTWEGAARTLVNALGLTMPERTDPPAESFGEPTTSFSALPADSTVAHGAATTAAIASPSSILESKQFGWHADLDLPDSFLLRADCEIVPFHPARKDLLEEILTWAEDTARPITLRLQIGEGGTGKTRLMIEACRLLRARGWQAGFVGQSRERLAGLQGLLATSARTLIVIDYAESRRTDLLTLLNEVLKPAVGRHIRVVLLARAAGDWWDNLPDEALEPVVEGFLRGRSTSGPYRIPRLPLEQEVRRVVFDQALRAFAPRLGRALEGIPAPDLSAPHFAHVLFVHLAALTSLYGEHHSDARALLLATLKREREYWARVANAEGLLEQWHSGISQAVALITLAGGSRSAAEARQLLAETPRLRGMAEVERSRVLDLLRRFYPLEGGIDALRPDLLGERLVAVALEQDDELLDIVLGEDAPDERASRALTVLNRMARHDSADEKWLRRGLSRHLMAQAAGAMNVAIETGDPLGRILADCLKTAIPAVQYPIYTALRPLLPEKTIALGELAVVVHELRLAELIRKGGKGQKAEHNIAGAYSTLSICLGKVGQSDRALDSAKEALKLSHRLGQSSDPISQRILAGALGNFSNRLLENGDYDQALSHIEQAERIYKQLLSKGFERYRTAWASTLGNRATCLRHLGRRDEALRMAQQEEHVYRTLANTASEPSRGAWAQVIGNLGAHEFEVGRWEDGLVHTQQSEALYRELAASSPDAYLPDWARLLGNLAGQETQCGHFEDGLQHAQQAAAIYRDLAALRPEAYQADWARSMSNLANHKGNLGKHGDGFVDARGAEIIYREHALTRPEAYGRDLAWSIGVVAIRLCELRRFEESLTAANESERMYRALSVKLPDAHRPNWAHSLTQVAWVLVEAGRACEALEPAQEGAGVFESLPKQTLAVHELHYGVCLTMLAEALLAQGNPSMALDQARTAEALLAKRFQIHPPVVCREFSRAIEVQARAHEASSLTGEAVANAARAYEALLPHFRKRPLAMKRDMKRVVATLRRLTGSSQPDPVAADVVELLSQVEEALE